MKRDSILALSIAVLSLALLAWAGFSSRPSLHTSHAHVDTKTAGNPDSDENTKNSDSADSEPLKSGQTEKNEQQSNAQEGTPVVLTKVTRIVAEDRLNVLGTGDAVATVSIVPKSSGILTEVLIESGQRVNAGDLLATLDSEAEKIALDKANQAIADARLKLDRFDLLRDSQAVSGVQIDQAKSELENARLAKREAELLLERRSITAPFTGVVGIVSAQTGAFVLNDSELATLDDRRRLTINFWVPERFAGLIRIGHPIEAAATALPGTNFLGAVSAVGSRIEQSSRTMQIQATIANSEDTLRPGMSFSVKMGFSGRSFPALDPLAIQWSSEGSYVWKVINGRAQKAKVKIVQRIPEAVLVEGDLQVDDTVVIEGVLAMRESKKIRDVTGLTPVYRQVSKTPSDQDGTDHGHSH